jgi:hypothetical protein
VATWLVLAPAVALVLLGVVLILAPKMGAAIFGIPAEGPALGYLPAIGLRDIAFGSYVLALAALSGRHAVGIVLAVTTLIPAGDLVLILAERGLSSPAHLLLHGVSGIYIGTAALWALTGAGAGRGTAPTGSGPVERPAQDPETAP